MSDYFIATILPWPVRFYPEGFFPCDGRQMAINQYQALYALIGNTYGGDGRTYFNLPNLNNRLAVGAGTNRQTGTVYPLGYFGGDTPVQNVPQIVHTHSCAGGVSTSLSVSTQASSTSVPTASTVIAQPSKPIYTAAPGDTDIGQLSMTAPVLTALDAAGAPQPLPVDTTPPQLAMQYIICWDGLYPYLQ